jgi:hypothetical protein
MTDRNEVKINRIYLNYSLLMRYKGWPGTIFINMASAVGSLFREGPIGAELKETFLSPVPSP